MWMKGRMWKWCEKGVFVSFSRENRSFLFCGYISDFDGVYHLILLVPPPVASGIESVQSLAASQDDVQVLVTPGLSLSESQSQELWQTQGRHNCFWLLWTLCWMQVAELSVGFWEQAGKRRRVIVETPLFTSNAITLEQFHFLWTSLKVCFYLLLPWIIHSLWMRVIGVWLSQAGLLCPLSSNCFGML